MIQRASQAMAAGGLALAFAIAPLSALHSQSKPGQQGTWGTTPGQTNPGAPTGTTPGQTPTTPTPTTTTTTNTTTQGDIRADAAFIREAASANLMEVQLGQTAQVRATNSAVKQFGQRMVNDHTNLENQLATMAASNGLQLKQSLSSKHEDEVKRLNKLSGQPFDSAYMKLMVKAHQEDLAKFQSQSQSAKSLPVRNFAINALPVLQQHLSLATQVSSQVGLQVATDTSSTTVGGNTGGNANLRADGEFIRDVGAGTAMFVQLGEIAQNKAKNQAVRQFAERTRSAFEGLESEWSSMTSNNGMKMSTGMGKRHHEKIEKLQKASGKNFDKTFMTLMVQQLHDRVTYWQKEGLASKSAPVRNLVNRGLPTQEELYTEAQQVARQVGVNPEKALKNRTDIANKDEKDKDKDKDK